MQSILEISLKKVRNNWKILNKYSNHKSSAVVKANAYGFGLVEIAKELNKSGCNFFYVAQFEEGVELRAQLKSNNIKIAVFEGILNKLEEYEKYKLTPIINNLDQLDKFIQYNENFKKIQGILNIDTGMNRLGLEEKDITYILNNIEKYKNINYEFIMSHFSNSNLKNDATNEKQFKTILNFVSYFKNKKISLSNTGGILLDKKFILDQARPGIGIYGYDANGKNIKLDNKKLKFPAVLKTPIIQIRDVKKGEKISYGGTEKVSRNSKLATIGIGYADGILRLLKNKMKLSINGKSCNIVGLITMDSMIVDITDIEIKNLKIGSYFELINEEILNNLDMDNSKINIYELFTLMSDRVIRKYKN